MVTHSSPTYLHTHPTHETHTHLTHMHAHKGSDKTRVTPEQRRSEFTDLLPATPSVTEQYCQLLMVYPEATQLTAVVIVPLAAGKNVEDLTRMISEDMQIKERGNPWPLIVLNSDGGGCYFYGGPGGRMEVRRRHSERC